MLQIRIIKTWVILSVKTYLKNSWLLDTTVIQNKALWERAGQEITRPWVSKVLWSSWLPPLTSGINSREGAEKGLLVPVSSMNPSVFPQTNSINVSRNQSPWSPDCPKEETIIPDEIPQIIHFPNKKKKGDGHGGTFGILCCISGLTLQPGVPHEQVWTLTHTFSVVQSDPKSTGRLLVPPEASFPAYDALSLNNSKSLTN